MAMAVLMVARGVASELDQAIAMMTAARARVRLRTTQRRVALEAIDILRARRLIQEKAA